MKVKDISENLCKVESAIHKLENFKKMELSDIEDKIMELESLRESISTDYDNRINILRYEFDSILNGVVVNRMEYSIGEDFRLRGTVFNVYDEPIALIDIVDVRKSFMWAHYRSYLDVLNNKLCEEFIEYIKRRFDYTVKVNIDGFKILFCGGTYPINLTLL